MREYLKTGPELKTDKRAVTMMEYGLVAALIVVFCITIVTTFAGNVTTMVNTVSGKIDAVIAGG